jgi:hypothetical protein
MAYNITQLKADLEGIGHGTTINQITNINGLINRAARQLLLDVDPQETKRIVELGAQLFQDVYNYALPTDVKGNKVIDLFPQVRRSSHDQFQQQYNEEFDVYKNKTRTPIFTINFDTSVKTIRIAKSFVVPIQTNIAESITENGTWAVGGGAQSLIDDSINFVAGTGSIRFTLDSGSTTGYIENSTMASVNLERDVDQGVEFVWVYMSEPDLITDVTLRWGSSSSDYWQNTVTTAWDGTAFQTGWNQLGFEWEDATSSGSPDEEDVTYLRIGFTYDNSDGDIQNMRINDFTSSLGTILNIEYYSKYLFRDATTGAYQETVTDNTNLINLDTESYNLLTYQCALLMAQQQQGADSGFDYNFFKKEYDTALARYKAMYKSEIIKPKQAYYKRTDNNFRRWFGNGPQGGASGY